MAGNINSPIVLDFFGLPGCGKSTVSHLLADKLREKGYRVYEPSYDLDHRLSPGRRKIEKMRQYVFYTVLHPVKARKITELVKDNGYKTFSERLSQRLNIATKLTAVKKRNYDYIIFDEGFNQAAISLALNCRESDVVFSNYSVIKDIAKNHLHIVPIYLEIDIETVLLRLQKRGEKDSRVDAENDPAIRKKLVEQFAEKCETLISDDVLRVRAIEANEVVQNIYCSFQF